MDLTRAEPLMIDGEQIADDKLYTAARAEKKLSLYGISMSESFTPILDQFKKDTGIDYEYLRLPTQKMYDRVLAEVSANKFEADYADLSDLAYMKEWLERGILTSYKVPNFETIPSTLKEPQGYWYYVSRIPYVIGVNTAVVKGTDYPKKWSDLYDAKWNGLLGLQNMEGGGSALTIWAFLRMQIGEDSWSRINQTKPRYYASSPPLDNDLVRGRIGIGAVTASTIARQIENGAPIAVIFPEDGIPSFGAFGNVTSNAKHPNAAKLWMNYITSKRGSLAVSKTGVYGTHPDAPPPQLAGTTFPPASHVWNIPADKWGNIRANWPEEWKRVMAR